MKKEKIISLDGANEEKKSVKIYPDIANNKKERRKALIYGAILIFFMGGMGVSIFLQGISNPETASIGYVMGAILIILTAISVSSIPASFKQYPVDGKPVIEFTSKEIRINDVVKKFSDVLEMRLTITLAPVGNKEENEKFVDSLLDKEPPKNVVGNLDFAVKDIGKKGETTKTLYTTVADSYEALVSLYAAGVKHYSIVYSLKKIAKKSAYSLNDSTTKDGSKLSDLSKKDRLKQLF